MKRQREQMEQQMEQQREQIEELRRELEGRGADEGDRRVRRKREE